ncbi:hypothetical protein G6L37_04070 [Agrobacterium rubi]|nr:hypothetical protein [Agrobacterium rubi]NTF24527.1 hypothetical protein [Agrobacterium rubi]
MENIDDDDLSDDEIAIERIVTDERSEARKAREIVSQAMMSASTPLENRDVKRRMLPGLWYCAVNVLIASLDMDDILRLMKDRMSSISGTAENADAPPRVMSPHEMKQYVHEVGLASETIMEALEAAHEEMEDAEIEDRFPETVFDTALRVLVPAWGPDHVRRAIIEQCAVFIKGRAEAVNFMEPSRVLDPAAARRRPVEAAPVVAREAAQPAQTRLLEFEFKPRVVRDRKIRAFVGSDVTQNGRGVWAAAMSIRDESGRYEFRKFGGCIDEPSGARLAVLPLHEVCIALLAMKDRAQVVIETTDELVRRAMEAGKAGESSARREADRPSWADIDHATTVHDLSLRHVSPALTDLLQESCDHLIRELAKA